MKLRVYWSLIIATLLLAACRPTDSEPTAAITLVSIASSTPEPTLAPTETATSVALPGERQQLEGYFSFITPENYAAELEEDSVFISDDADKIFISLAIIGAGEDERTAHSLLDEIFEKFKGYEIQNSSNTTVGGLAGSKADFSGVLSETVVSGNYVIVDLGDGVSLLAFGMGDVSKENNTWDDYGRLNFTQLLATVEILFGTY